MLGKKYFVYQHIRHDKNEIFYIGIGTQSHKGLYYSRAYCTRGRNRIWKGITGKTTYSVEIIFESDIKKEVQDMEMKLISKYGRRCLKTGPLANITDGGELGTGVKRSKKFKDKISKSLKARFKSDPSFILNMVESNYIPVIETRLDGSVIEWSNIVSAANNYNLDRSSITKVCKGNRKTCNGSKWMYK